MVYIVSFEVGTYTLKRQRKYEMIGMSAQEHKRATVARNLQLTIQQYTTAGPLLLLLPPPLLLLLLLLLLLFVVRS